MMNALPDFHVTGFDVWPRLFQDPGYEIVVDPVVYRIGEMFLADGPARPAGGVADQSWSPIGDDVGALVTFFDLLSLHEKVPAFDYSVTFDPLSAKINTIGGKTIIQDVHVAPEVHRPIREAVVARGALKGGMAAGQFLIHVRPDRHLLK